MNDVTPAKRSGRRGRQDAASASPEAKPTGAALKNPFPVMTLFSEDFIEEMHESALRILEDMGSGCCSMKLSAFTAKAGHRWPKTARLSISAGTWLRQHWPLPKSITMRGGARHRDIELALGNLVFQPGAGTPYVNDRERGRRPALKISASWCRSPIILMPTHDPPLVESQDVPMHLSTMPCLRLN